MIAYAARPAAGLCNKCGTPAFQAMTYRGPCAVLHYAQQSPEHRIETARRKYAGRRARGLCTDCAGASQGAVRGVLVPPLDTFPGDPVWDPNWRVTEIATDREHGPFDSEADVALCLVFENLRRDQVGVVNDASPMSS